MKPPDLGKMIGPLPLGAWIGAVGGSVVFAYIIHRRRAVAVPVVPGQIASTAPANQYLAPDAATGGANGNGTDTANMPGVPSPSLPFTYTTNAQWQSRVYVLMAATHPEFSLVLAGNALNNYLQGNPMTDAEQNYISTTLRDFGPPPFAPQPALVNSPPRTYLPPPPPAVPAPTTPNSSPYSWSYWSTLPAALQRQLLAQGIIGPTPPSNLETAQADAAANAANYQTQLYALQAVGTTPPPVSPTPAPPTTIGPTSTEIQQMIAATPAPAAPTLPANFASLSPALQDRIRTALGVAA